VGIAVTALRAALAAGHITARDLDVAAELAPLRGRPAFQALQASAVR
jgi:hypothetical protein